MIGFNLRRRGSTKGSRQSQVTLVEVHDGVNRRRGDLIQGAPPPDEQNQLLQDQTQCTIPTPDCNTCLLKQGELR